MNSHSDERAFIADARRPKAKKRQFSDAARDVAPLALASSPRFSAPIHSMRAAAVTS